MDGEVVDFELVAVIWLQPMVCHDKNEMCSVMTAIEPEVKIYDLVERRVKQLVAPSKGQTLKVVFLTRTNLKIRLIKGARWLLRRTGWSELCTRPFFFSEWIKETPVAVETTPAIGHKGGSRITHRILHDLCFLDPVPATLDLQIL